MCENLSGPNAPFCSPSTNTTVRVGQTVEVTWDRRFFNSSSPFGSSSTLFIQADFGSTSRDPSIGGLDGFTSPPLDPQSGRFTWTILDSFLTSGGVGTTSRGSRLFLAPETSQVDEDTGLTSTTVRRITGPRVVILARDDRAASGQPNPLSIALPVGLGAFVVLIIGVLFCMRRWKVRDRNINNQGARDVEMKGAGASQSGERTGFWGRIFPAGGYGIGQSKMQRIGIGRKKGKGKGGDIEIVHSTHMNAVGGAAGGPVRMGFLGGGGRGGGYAGGAGRSNGNVFRDEVRRQDRGRGSDYL